MDQSREDSLVGDGNRPEQDITAEALFNDVIKDASPADILAEFYWFERNLVPQLLEHVGTNLVNEVKKHLGIDHATEMVSSDTIVKATGENFPILDALSFKMGLCLRNILTPPLSETVQT